MLGGVRDAYLTLSFASVGSKASTHLFHPTCDRAWLYRRCYVANTICCTPPSPLISTFDYNGTTLEQIGTSLERDGRFLQHVRRSKMRRTPWNPYDSGNTEREGSAMAVLTPPKTLVDLNLYILISTNSVVFFVSLSFFC